MTRPVFRKGNRHGFASSRTMVTVEGKTKADLEAALAKLMAESRAFVHKTGRVRIIPTEQSRGKNRKSRR